MGERGEVDEPADVVEFHRLVGVPAAAAASATDGRRLHVAECAEADAGAHDARRVHHVQVDGGQQGPRVRPR